MQHQITSEMEQQSEETAISFVTTEETVTAWCKLRQEQSLDDSQLAALLLEW